MTLRTHRSATPGRGYESGSDGLTYWNVFNIEGESSVTAGIVTYGSLSDMLHDTNRLQDVSPNSQGFGRNVVGSGSDNFPTAAGAVPEPATWGLMLVGFLALGAIVRRQRALSPA